MSVGQVFVGPVPVTGPNAWTQYATVMSFGGHEVVVTGESNTDVDEDVRDHNGRLRNGSRIYVPANAAGCIIRDGIIDEMLDAQGGYVYSGPDAQLVFVRTTPVPNVSFATSQSLKYFDKMYASNLDVRVATTVMLRVANPTTFMENFGLHHALPLSFDDRSVHRELLPDFLRSFAFALRHMSEDYLIDQVPNSTDRVIQLITEDGSNAGRWWYRYGLAIVDLHIERLEFTERSLNRIRRLRRRALVQH